MKKVWETGKNLINTMKIRNRKTLKYRWIPIALAYNCGGKGGTKGPCPRPKVAKEPKPPKAPKVVKEKKEKVTKSKVVDAVKEGATTERLVHKNDLLGDKNETEEQHMEKYKSLGKGVIKNFDKVKDKSIELLDMVKKVNPEAYKTISGFTKKEGFELKKLALKDVTQSQFGEEFINPSSQHSAKSIASGDASKIARADIAPIILDNDNKIVDGNHRFAAAQINGQENIYAWVPQAGVRVVRNSRWVELESVSTYY